MTTFENPARILIVEDEALVAADLEKRLQKLGYDVATITDNGPDALRFVEADRPDLALMDIRIIGPMDGVETADQLRKRFQVPVVFLTSYSDSATLARAGLTEPFGYIVKPFEERDLHATIEMAFYRARAEERVRKMERWLSATLHSIGDAVIATEKDGRVTYVNPVAEILTQWPRSHAVGLPCETVFRVVHGAENKPVTNLVNRAVEGGVTFPLDQNVRLITQEGRAVPIEDSVAPIRDEEGRITGAVIVFRDCSERLKAEDEHRRLEEKMQQAQKLESLGLLASGVAHDFKNILTVIVGSAALLRMNCRLESRAQEYVRQIETASQRATDLCRQIMTFAGKASTSFQPVDLNKVVKETMDLLRVSLPKSTRLVLDAAPELPLADVDAAQAHQVVMNLVINGSEALQGAMGDVSVKTSVAHTSPSLLPDTVASPGMAESDYVCVEVRDTGCGMSRETLARIFDPFFTTKLTGRGLGLAAVLGIVRRHEAAIQVESQPGHGSTFRLFFRPATDTVVEARVPSSPAPAAWSGAGTVLLVDDEPAVRIVTRRMLEAIGFNVVEAANGREALAVQAAREETFTLAVVDVAMPQMGGLELLRTLRTISADLPVLLVSGHSRRIVREVLRLYRRCAFLDKPFTHEQLKEKLREVLER